RQRPDRPMRRRLLPLALAAVAAASCLALPAPAQDRVMARVADSAVTFSDMRDEARFWRLNDAPDDEMERLVFAMIDRLVLLERVRSVSLDADDRASVARLADEAMRLFRQRHGGAEGLQRAL